MKYLFFTVLGLAIAFWSNIGYTHNGGWIAVQAPLVAPPVVEVPAVPSVTYSTYPQWPVLMYPRYDWVPHYVNRLVVVEKRGLLCRHKTYYYEPTVEWIYTPRWKPALY